MNSALIDLHVHTSASDGTMTPEEAVLLAARSGLKAIAVTDHDTVDGVAEALATGAKAGLEVVPGIEISVDYNGEMHILGYYVNSLNDGFREGLANLSRYRAQRNPQIINKLRKLNFHITLEDVSKVAGAGVVGRPHFARAMLQKGYVHSLDEAFDLYLGAGRAAYVKKERLTPNEGIQLIALAGGIPVLAHPKYLKIKGGQGLAGLLPELIGYGLKGIEVFYTSHTPAETREYAKLAALHGLLMTGGSDFHGANKPEITIGRGKGNLAVDYELLQRIKDSAGIL